MKNTPPTSQPTFLTVAQAAVRLRKSEEFVRLLCKEGGLFGAVQDYERGPWRIPSETVETWMQQHTVNGANQFEPAHVEQAIEPRPSISVSPASPGWWERFRYHPLIFYPTTVFIVLTAIVAFVGILISSGADFSAFHQQLSEWGIPIKEFAAESKGETLIVIATFHTTAATNAEPHVKIQRAIEAEAAELGEQRLRVAVEPTELTADQRTQAEALGKRYNASMVIWGEDTGVEIIVNFLNLKEPNFAAAPTIITERERTQLANPSAYARFITNDLPQQMTFFALFAIGHSYYLKKEYTKAIARIEAAVALLPPTALPDGLVSAYFLLGWLYHVSTPNNLSQAIANYDKAIELNPYNATGYYNRGVARNTQGKLDEAIADYDKSIALNPNDADAYNNLGVAHKAQGMLDEAIADYDKAIALNPNDANAYFNRGNAYRDQGELDAAIADYNRAIELNPNDAVIYVARGNVREAQEEVVEAIADYNNAIKLSPYDGNAYYNRGNALLDQGELDAAIADYTRSIELKNPELYLSYNNRGSAHIAQGDLNSALANFDKAIELNPNDALAFGNRGAVHVARGDLNTAIADYDKAIALDPDFAFAYYMRGSSLNQQGSAAAALADLHHYLELQPEAENRIQVEQLIAQLEAELAKEK